MWRRVLDILKYLGLEDDLREISGARDSTRELLSTRVPVFFHCSRFRFCPAQAVHYRKGDEAEAVEFRVFAPASTVHSPVQRLLSLTLCSN